MTPIEVTRCIRSFALLKWLSLPLFEAISQVRRQRAWVAPAGTSMTVTPGTILLFPEMLHCSQQSESTQLWGQL